MRDLINQWKAEALRDARRRAERCREAYVALKQKDTVYATAIRTMAEIHERALAVYAEACGPEVPLEDHRCACCGWPLAASVAEGCVRGNCSQRPQPLRMYDPERFARELPLPRTASA